MAEVKPESETKVPPAPLPDYDLHVRFPGEKEEMLKDAARLACKMGLIEKPELTGLFSLFVEWGMNGLKILWLEKMGFK